MHKFIVIKTIELSQKAIYGKTRSTMSIGDFINGTTFVNLTQHFAAFGLQPSDNILSTPLLISTTVDFISDTFSDE